ncbi:hypothetical protein P3W43_06600 [Salinicola salarius]|uniref:hypothetical protein n=1 Tax=Salinicola salarius TaxID=430457 RepID=UPI0023E43A75|nr:hypothetical protein [Salinicola salarius]MDF3918522.1 hypothetical protein [Salinicola salarius]
MATVVMGQDFQGWPSAGASREPGRADGPLPARRRDVDTVLLWSNSPLRDQA